MKDLINIAGIVPFTTIDYPDCLSAVLFCQGCAWRCHYCHNPHLQTLTSNELHSWKETYQFLKSRKNFLDAVVFSGGDPLLQPGLKEAILQVKDFGLKVGLHTAGMHPLRLQAILSHINWIGMDVKAPFDSYKKITNIENSGKQAKLSVEAILASGVDYEFRTTVHPKILSIEDLYTIANDLKKMNAESFVLQKFRPNGCFTIALNDDYSFAWDLTLIEHLKNQFRHFQIRE